MSESFHYRTFTKLAIAPYVGGTVAHSLRLIYKLPLIEAPFWIHWAIVLVGGYVVSGFIRFARMIKFRGIWDKILYGIVVIHLGTSVIMHLYSISMNTNAWMGIFPMGYSYFAIVYFVGLGLYCFILNRRIQTRLN